MIGAAVFGLAALGLVAASDPATPLAFTYGCLLLVGVSRSFLQPSLSSYLPELAPPAALAKVNAWIAASYEIAAIGGPALAGVLIAATKSAALAFWMAAFFQLVFIGILLTLPARRPLGSSAPHSAKEIFAGLHFIRRTPIFLAAITLDLLAVLVGGAVALLPVYAKDILHVGPTGLGMLRTAPAIGSLLMSIAVSFMKPLANATVRVQAYSGETLLGSASAITDSLGAFRSALTDADRFVVSLDTPGLSPTSQIPSTSGGVQPEVRKKMPCSQPSGRAPATSRIPPRSRRPCGSATRSSRSWAMAQLAPSAQPAASWQTLVGMEMAFERQPRANTPLKPSAKAPTAFWRARLMSRISTPMSN